MIVNPHTAVVDRIHLPDPTGILMVPLNTLKGHLLQSLLYYFESTTDLITTTCSLGACLMKAKQDVR